MIHYIFLINDVLISIPIKKLEFKKNVMKNIIIKQIYLFIYIGNYHSII